MTVDDFLRDKVCVSVPTLAAAADFSVDFVDLEVKRGNLVIVGKGRQRRVPAESARAWLLGLQQRRPTTTRRTGARATAAGS